MGLFVAIALVLIGFIPGFMCGFRTAFDRKEKNENE